MRLAFDPAAAQPWDRARRAEWKSSSLAEDERRYRMQFGDSLKSKRAALTACQLTDHVVGARALAGIQTPGLEGSGCSDADSDEVRSCRPHIHASHTRLIARRMQQGIRPAGRDRLGRGTAFADLAAEGAVTKLERPQPAPG